VRDGAGGEGSFPARPGVTGRFEVGYPSRDRHGRASGQEARSGVLVRGVVRPCLRLARLRVNGSSAACKTLGE
jgi:hypothetical protein